MKYILQVLFARILLCSTGYNQVVTAYWPERFSALGVTPQDVTGSLLTKGIAINLQDTPTGKASATTTATAPLSRRNESDSVFELYTKFLQKADGAASPPTREGEINPSNRRLRLADQVFQYNEENDARQIIYVDFNNIVGGVYPVVLEDFVTGNEVVECFPAYEYSKDEQDEIIKLLEDDFSVFDVAFTTKKPNGRSFATLLFNANVVDPQDCFATGPLGLAFSVDISFTPPIHEWNEVTFGFAPEGIDFRNLKLTDGSIVDQNFWTFLVEIDPTGELLESYSGLSLDDGVQAALSEALVASSAATGAHEIGHTMGLRHHDSFGPPGSGLPTTGTPGRFNFLPAYPGPTSGSETLLHLMISGASVGSDFADEVTDRFFSERSAIKLIFAESDANVMTEGQFRSLTLSDYSFGLEIPPLKVPNTILEGINENGEGKYDDLLDVYAMSILGSFRSFREVDTYRLFLFAGDIMTFETILSDIINPNPSDTFITLYYEDPLNDFSLTEIVYNDDPFESFEGMILDYPVPFTGTYVLDIRSIWFDYDPSLVTSYYDVLIYGVVGPTEDKKSSKGSKGKGRTKRRRRTTVVDEEVPRSKDLRKGLRRTRVS